MFASFLRCGGSILVFALAPSIVSTAAAANVIHVPGNAPTIQAGIDMARDGDMVLVAPGTYNEAIDFLGKTIIVESSDGAEVTIIDATGLDTSVVSVRSGEGDGTELRGFTITGGIGTYFGQAAAGGRDGDVPRIEPRQPENGQVRGGDAVASGHRLGGGIFVWGASILVEHCIIVDNHVPYASSSGGGGFMLHLPQNVMFRYCTIENNSGFLGGGGTVVGGFVPIRNCTVRNNAADQGGGLNVNNSATAAIWQCIFESNVAGHFNETTAFGGGVITVFSNSTAILTQSEFLNNTSDGRGGGLSANNATVNQCVFEANTALRGGAIESSGNLEVQASHFVGNEASGTDWEDGGGGIYAGGFISTQPVTTITGSTFIGNIASGSTWGSGGGALLRGMATLSDCTFQDNSARNGGGIYLLLRQHITPTISGCTFTGNSASEIGGGMVITKWSSDMWWPVSANVTECHFEDNAANQGGGLFVGGSSEFGEDFGIDIAHSTFAGNTAQFGGGLLLNTTMSDPQSPEGPHPTVRHCSFLGNSAGSGGGVYSAGSQSRARFTDCTFENNTAVAGGGATTAGGGLQWPGQFFIDCTFAGNHASGSGGGLSIGQRTSVANGVFASNTAQGNGGAVSGGSLSSWSILEHSMFSGNQASSGGAVAGNPAISQCSFENNHALADGGAIHGAGSTTHSTFTGNSAGDRGGAIAVPSGSPTIAGCEMIGNSAGDEGGAIFSAGDAKLQANVACANTPDNVTGGVTDLGGNHFTGICHTGEVILVPQDYATIQAAIDAALHGDEIVVAPGTYNEAIDFSGKRLVLRSSDGPGVTIIDAAGWPASTVTIASFEPPGTTLRGFTITGGTGVDGTGSGGGVYIRGAALLIDDCTITGNSATSGGGVTVNHTGLLGGGAITITESRIVDNQATHFGGGIVGFNVQMLHVGETLFRDNSATFGGGLVLRSLSHGTCTGCEFRNNSASANGGAVAVEWDAVYESADSLYCGSTPNHIGPLGPSGGQWTDLGGNEFLDDCPPGSIVGDLNGDGVVDVSDLLILLAAWGTCADPGDCPADLNGDGAVDVSDLLILLSNWG